MEKEKILIEELKMIQDIIKRMADNSFKLKNWCLTVVVVTMLFQEGVNNFIPIISLFGFWFLDSYYLYIEREFRNLYNTKARQFNNNANLKQSMQSHFIFEIDGKFTLKKLFIVGFSKTILYFYGVILILILLVKYKKNVFNFVDNLIISIGAINT
ncbi:TPA: hypothetical protein RZK44_000252 [Campylobacter coli]|nr:hypothetical protein [Campylobacter coli]HED6594880.1 hypothetical protein [Campylobacter coli]HED6602278.1 hypothetical protein [Campylobacter coli]